MVDLPLVRSNLGRDRVGKLAEPAHVAHDERCPGGESRNRARRGLAEGGAAQADANVAAADERAELRRRHIAPQQHLFPRLETERLEPDLHRSLREAVAGEDEPCLRKAPEKTRVRAEELR